MEFIVELLKNIFQIILTVGFILGLIILAGMLYEEVEKPNSKIKDWMLIVGLIIMIIVAALIRTLNLK